jgi:hypothetical protein
MKRLGSLAGPSLAGPALIIAALLAVACVSTPPDTTETVKAVGSASEQVKKERIEEFKTPMILKETIQFADGVIDRVITYTYDDGYRHLLSTIATKPSSIDPIERVVYGYDNGVLAVKTLYGSDGIVQSKTAYDYSPDGLMTKETVLDGKDMVQSISEWTWEGSRKVSWRVISTAGLTLAKTEYVYDHDMLVASSLFDGSGTPKGRIAYAYGEANALVTVSYFNAAGAQDGRTEYTLKDGRPATESVYRADGRLERKVSYEYGAEGALLKKIIADASGTPREIATYDYAYRTDTRVIYYE